MGARFCSANIVEVEPYLQQPVNDVKQVLFTKFERKIKKKKIIRKQSNDLNTKNSNSLFNFNNEPATISQYIELDLQDIKDTKSNDINSITKIAIVTNDFTKIISNINAWKKLIQSLLARSELLRHVLSKSRNELSSFNELKNHLICSPTRTQTEKAWVLFVWITHNIEYDYNAFLKNIISSMDADDIFIKGKCLSAGYSSLFCFLATTVFQLECISISGYAKGYGYSVGDKFTDTNHDWNAVKIDNEWKLVEPTWGAGYVQLDSGFIRKFEPHYFFTPPEIFIYEHFPDCDQFQFLDKTLSIDDYEQLAFYRLQFFLNGLYCISHDKGVIHNISNPFKMEFQVPFSKEIFGYIETIKGVKIENCVFAQRDLNSNYFNVEVSLPNNSKSKLRLYVKEIGNNNLEWMCDYILSPSKFIKKHPFYCKINSSFTKPVYLHGPKESQLQVKKEYMFKVTVEAIDVALIDSRNNWILLKKSSLEENTWSTSFMSQFTGKLKLTAKTLVKSSYDVLFEYDIVNIVI